MCRRGMYAVCEGMVRGVKGMCGEGVYRVYEVCEGAYGV